jgi:Asp-tRNA(Asn)/Glu-tRNA(Gln) amidotransferase A subunit family amidase
VKNSITSYIPKLFMPPSNSKFGALKKMSTELHRLTATEVLAKIKAGELSVTEYANSLVARIQARDEAVQAWAYFDPKYVLEQAKALDAIPSSERGPLHGVAIAVKDVIYTKGRYFSRSFDRLY